MGTVRLWDADTGEALGIIQNGSIIWGVNWTADSHRLLTWSVGRAARIWDIEALLQQTGEDVPSTNTPLATFSHDDVVAGALWSADETQVLTWSFDGNAALWNAATGQPLVVMPHAHIIWRALWVGDRVITSSFDDTVRIWTPGSTDGIGRNIEPDVIVYHPDANFSGTTLNSDGHLALSSGLDASVVWDTETGGQYMTLPPGASDGIWHPSGQYLLVVGDGTATVFAAASGERAATIVDTAPILSARWGPNGKQIVTVADDGVLAVWEPTLLPSTSVAQVSTALPTPTQVPPPTLNPDGPTPTPPSRRSYALGPGFQRMQTFIAEDNTINSVDLRLSQATDREQFGDVLVVSILDLDGNVLAMTEQFVLPGFDDWLQVNFAEAVTLNAGETYILAVSAQLDTDNPPRWVIEDNAYPDGVGGRDFEFAVGYDFQFRFDTTEAAVSIPHVTITLTLTPTTIPPAETATIEAAWYNTGIFSTGDPRLAHLNQVPTGGTLEFFLGYFECCYFIEHVDDFDVRWSIDRTDIANIDEASGVLTVNEDAEPGVIMITASAIGLSQSVEVYVYDPTAQPYIGVWREVDRQLCTEDTFTESGVLIYEFIIAANGRFSVSWEPFEVYVDYVGEYTIDGENLTLDDEPYNYNPFDFQGNGMWYVDDEGRLVLDGIWLGTSPFGGDDPPACAHRFERVAD